MKGWNAPVQDGGVLLWLVVALCFIVLPASAHKPTYTEGGHSSMEEAFPIIDPDMSIVLYHPVACESQVLWLGFNFAEARSLYVQLGVPQIERLKDYRPTIAVVAKGLSEPDMALPFALPEGYGARVFDTATVDSPTDFFEPFTGTASWILHESTEELPAGVGYVVAWHPAGQTGKLWVAVGDVEKFTPEDFENAAFWLEATQTFHETGNYVPEITPVETVCTPEPETEPEESDLDTESGATDAANAAQAPTEADGCTAGPGRHPRSPLPLLLLCGSLALLLLGRRRSAGSQRL